MNRTKIIPAIDLLGGRVVRLHQGNYAESTVYEDRPSAPVERFLESGVRRIHVVDLDAARSGDRSINQKARDEIVSAARESAELQLGGGIRDLDTVRQVLGSGFDRAILGTAAVKDPDFLKEALENFSERIIVGVDARDGIVRVSGWEEASSLQTMDYFETLEQMRVNEVIYTNIATDGTLAGPPVEEISEILNRFRFRLIASGGISSLEDVKKLLDLEQSRLSGIITGKAVYEGRLDLKSAVKLSGN
ncbi:MAG TPA: 1-(5-phosphoribosyl)-5-[(5-phosphoribosylamino)methylideneamino]imidazole-4-carboxamide isomerase [Leptospiraceae bacterium]|jgi:phosphoribosylformimino-5-aminoimidazole carboxamide ribotide isomerase|nr:1-(5-phosphoribosyl)-5-[(5-phosphoribosylamino)methylideneamino]imidazole-4-carboxamide isomerase [Spirochaetaceae bacterium]HBS06149.1 1-(5-phosphoribosyl)-5-[(5-phosphoribosylamino)methylideneamino]imidazole-4-carboxamide isomerase [Leptospiraceae bacterium]|tara:strand:- start:63415 stop:64158 length:744 start_codon:yes stop_codon:yes gene_type:complete